MAEKTQKKNNIYKSGLSFMEALFVIGFTTVLAMVVFYGFSSGRAKTRDVKRFADLQNIQIALELFFLDKGYYPREKIDNATGRIGEGGKIDLLLLPYMSGMPPSDPLGPGEPKYYYFYDGNHNCGEKSINMAVVFASNIEKIKGNSSNLCSNWDGEKNEGNLNSWNIVIGKSGG